MHGPDSPAEDDAPPEGGEPHCQIDRITLIANAGPKPGFLPSAPFEPPGGGPHPLPDINDIGPTRTRFGLFGAHGLWVLFEGRGLDDCDFQRFIAMSGTRRGQRVAQMDGGGYRGPHHRLDDHERKLLDPGGVRRIDSTVVIVADAPGWGFSRASLPGNFDANSYVRAVSLTTSRVCGRIWYDVNIRLGPDGEPIRNEASFTAAMVSAEIP